MRSFLLLLGFLFGAKCFGQSIQSLDKALKINPQLAIAYLERARAKAQAGNRSGAKQDYQNAQKMGIKLEPMDEQLLNGK